MPIKYKILIWIAVLVSLFTAIKPSLQSALAAITNSSRVIPYQGRLTDSSGNNVADSTYAMTFKIYTVSSGGSAAFTEAFSAGNAVSVSSGLFSVLLGSLSASGVNLDFANPPYYLGITVGTNAEMSPRIQLGFAPLAHNAQYLDGTPLSSLALASSVVIDNSLANGRLTLTSGTPVTTSDVTAATTVYYTPYNGNRISLYDGSSTWSTLTFSELSLSLSGYTANKNYDIWAYNNSGTVALESLVWTNDTARATALVLQDGINVKTGATTRRLLGTIRITGTTGQTEDSKTKRYVSNLNNTVERRFYRTASWSVPPGSSSGWWNADSTNRFDFVSTLDNGPIHAISDYHPYGGSHTAYAPGIGYDTNSQSDGVIHSGSSGSSNGSAEITVTRGLGYHYIGFYYGCYNWFGEGWQGVSADAIGFILN